MEPKVSVIVPIFNAGVHLEKCLNSLINQTLRAIEIIIVLDCPTDGSDQIAKHFSLNDPRIKLFYNDTNLHIGFSRNVGLKHVTGKYIAFMDHDDYCEHDMYELLYEKAENENLDVVRCNFSFDYILNQDKIKNVKYIYPYDLQTSTTSKTIKKILHRKCATQLWNYLFKADMINEQQITFVDTRNCNTEDGIFILETLFCAKRTGSINDYKYYHVEHEKNSAKNYNYFGILPTICFLEHVEQKIKNRKVEGEYYKDYLIGLGYFLYSLFRKALITKDLKRVISTVRLIQQSKLNENLNMLYKPKNIFIWLRIKPMVATFLLLVKLSAPKKMN